MSESLLHLEYVEAEELHFYENNPRKNDAAVPKMVESLQEFGFRIPVLASRNGEVLDGHLRLKAALKMGMKTVPVIWADGLTESQIRAFRIMANRSVTWAEWDMGKLAEEIRALADETYNLAFTGFDVSELDRIVKENLRAAESYDPDEIPEVSPKEAEKRVHRGDVWRLGQHLVMCGDSTDADDMTALMGSDTASLWLTDPPYNVAYTGKTADALTIDNDSMDDDEFRRFLCVAYATADRVMKPGASFYIWHADSEGYNFRGAARDIGWKIRQCLIWKKQHFVMGRQDYQWKHEPCLYGWKEGESHHWYGGRNQTTVLEFDRPMRNAEHPTMKPVELFEFQIVNSCRHGEIVLDSFGGSGTTVIACQRTMRRARVMELSPHYAAVILKRWEDFTSESAELVSRRE